MRSWFPAISIAALAFAPGAATAQSDAVPTQLAAVERFVMQTPSIDGFVHIRLSPDLGDDLPALKAQLEQMPGVRVGDPADYELTNLRDFPETLLAVDQHQGEADFEQGFVGQELLEEHPYDLEDHPRTIILGNLVLGDYAEALRELVARTAAAKTLIALGQRGAKDEIETCVKSADPETGDARVSVQCHPGRYREPKTDMAPRPTTSHIMARKYLSETVPIDRDTSSYFLSIRRSGRIASTSLPTPNLPSSRLEHQQRPKVSQPTRMRSQDVIA